MSDSTPLTAMMSFRILSAPAPVALVVEAGW